MPQFQIANFVPQLAWLALFFAILYFAIVKLTLPKVGNVIAAREGMVKADVDAAAAAKAQADATRDSYEHAMAAARTAAQHAISDGKAASLREIEGRLHAADAGTHARLAAAEAAIADQRRAAESDLNRIAAQAAADIVASLTGTRPDEQAAAAAVAHVRAA